MAPGICVRVGLPVAGGAASVRTLVWSPLSTAPSTGHTQHTSVDRAQTAQTRNTSRQCKPPSGTWERQAGGSVVPERPQALGPSGPQRAHGGQLGEAVWPSCGPLSPVPLTALGLLSHPGLQAAVLRTRRRPAPVPPSAWLGLYVQEPWLWGEPGPCQPPASSVPAPAFRILTHLRPRPSLPPPRTPP